MVVTYKAVENFFANLPNVQTAHFGAISGLNVWSDIDNIVVIGRPMPDPEATRRHALALGGKPVSAGQQPRRELCEVPMRSGGTRQCVAYRYEDQALEAARTVISDSELLQDIGRGRPLDRTAANPLNVWLLSDAALDLPLDSLEKWDADPREFMRREGALLSSPCDMTRSWPERFKSADAAQKRLARSSISTPFSKDNPLLKVGEITEWARVEYRPKGRGQQFREAWFDLARNPDPRLWLGRVDG